MWRTRARTAGPAQALSAPAVDLEQVRVAVGAWVSSPRRGKHLSPGAKPRLWFARVRWGHWAPKVRAQYPLSLPQWPAGEQARLRPILPERERETAEQRQQASAEVLARAPELPLAAERARVVDRALPAGRVPVKGVAAVQAGVRAAAPTVEPVADWAPVLAAGWGAMSASVPESAPVWVRVCPIRAQGRALRSASAVRPAAPKNW